MYHRLKDLALAGLAAFVSRRPRLVLALTFLSAALCVLITVQRVPLPGTGWALGPLQFQSNRNDLISPKLEWNRRFVRWQEGFPGTWDLIVVIDAGPDGPQRAARAAAAERLVNDLGPKLRDNEWVKSCVWGFDPGAVSPRAIRLETLDERQPTDEFRTWLGELRSSTLLLASATPEAFLARTLRELQAQESGPGDEARAVAGLDELAGVLGAFRTALEDPSDQPVDFDKLVRARAVPPWAYLVSDNGRLYFLRVTPRHAEGELNALAPAIAAVRQAMAEAAARHPGVSLGLTGIDVVETDETAVVDFDTTWIGALTGLLMLGLLVAAFQSWRTPLMIMLALAVGIAWSFGFTTLVVGHLQVISIVFVPLLLGLGIAYGIYIAARFEMVRHDYPDDVDGYTRAMVDTARTMGPGILTGCITTAAAFSMTLFTDFTGVAEMGLISSVGIVLCLVAMGSVFPSLVRLIKPAHKHIRRLESRTLHLYSDRWFLPFATRPWLTLGVAGALTVASLVSLWWMRFDYNLLDLQARGMESVEWERKIVEDGGESIWFGVSLVKDLDEARMLAARYRQKPTVGLVRGVGLLIPEDEARKKELLAEVRRQIDVAVDEAAGPAPAVSLDVQVAALNLAFALQSRRDDIPPAVRPHVARVGAAAAGLAAALASLPTSERPARLARLQRDYAAWRQRILHLARQATDPEPLTLQDLPPEILSPYRGVVDGREVLSLEVFPAARDPRTGVYNSALDPGFLQRFVADMRGVDPQVTGVVVQIYESGTLIQRSYVFAGVLGLVVVLVLVFLDFGNLRDALLSLLPVVVGFAVTFGIMRLAGQMINPANIVVLPLMFGIGVDSGVHLIYRWRMDPAGRPPGLTQGTGKGVITVNLATLIGFGAMMLARHRGIQSLGFVLTVGMAMTLLACLTIMPAWLELRNRRGQRRA